MSKYIAIDNGHGLNTAGKRTDKFKDGTKSALTGKDFMHEWEFNHATAKYLEVELKRCGFKTILVSDTEKDTSLKARTDTANKEKVDLFVSIHANALTGKFESGAKGIETYAYKTKPKGSTAVANAVQDELVKATGLYNRGVKFADFHVLRESNMSAILVECGFMDNSTEAKLLLTDSYRKKCAVAIAKGICKHYGVKYVEEVKPQEKATEEVFYRVVTGSFKDKENAQKRMYELEKHGFKSFLEAKVIK